MDLKAVVSGWKNYLQRTDVSDSVAMFRATICSGCEHMKHGAVLAWIADDLKEIQGNYCDLCKCPLSAKIRQSVDKCKINKW